MSKTKRYIEEQMEQGIDVLHPEWLNTQLDDSYEQYYMDQNEERKTNTSIGKVCSSKKDGRNHIDLPF
tara:strand:+ start:421 stop:624 length:204 start_codon:yes stop_codon:yes gene_type:complete